MVEIRDRRLGILHYAALIGIIIYILIFTVVINKVAPSAPQATSRVSQGYLGVESPIGAIRVSMRRVCCLLRLRAAHRETVAGGKYQQRNRTKSHSLEPAPILQFEVCSNVFVVRSCFASLVSIDIRTTRWGPMIFARQAILS
jgi:hypothetical protein